MKIVIPTCDKYVATIHTHVHFLRKLWASCPYEVLVVVGGTAPVPHAKEIDATIVHLGEDLLWASNFLRTHELFLQDDKFFILLMDDLIPYILHPSAVAKAIDTIGADTAVNQIRLGVRWVKRSRANPREYYGGNQDFIHMRREKNLYSNKATLWRTSVHKSVLSAGETSTRTEGNGSGRLQLGEGLNIGVIAPTLEQINWFIRGRRVPAADDWIKGFW